MHVTLPVAAWPCAYRTDRPAALITRAARGTEARIDPVPARRRSGMTRVGVLGAKGRMGSQVCQTVESAPDLELAAQVDAGDAVEALAGADVVVDFTHPGVVMG